MGGIYNVEIVTPEPQEGWMQVGHQQQMSYRPKNHGQQIQRLSLRRARGFTLIELLMVIAITAVLLGLTAPAFKKSIHDNRVQTYSNSLLVGLNLARNLAVQRGTYVIVCPSDTPNATVPACNATWANGWLVYSATSATGAPGVNNILKVGESGSTGTTSTVTTTVANIAGNNLIAFTSRGLVDNSSFTSTASPITITVNAASCTSGKDKQITMAVNSTGRTYTTAGTCP